MDDEDPDSDAPRMHQCVGCSVWSPPTNTNYTLISSQYGWRLSRELDPNGNKVMTWRCPVCWAKRKQVTVPTPDSQPPTSRTSNSQPPTSRTGNSQPPTSRTGNSQPPTSRTGNSQLPTSRTGNSQLPTSRTGNNR